jgi:putative tributyrin esterase
MALLQCAFSSEVLGQQVPCWVILPRPTTKDGKLIEEPRDYPVLYLLHGMSDDHTIWVRRTSIERYVANMNIAVVMPAAGRTFYTDMAVGPRYETFMAEELPSLVKAWFPISEKREDTHVAGLSMGGYGAIKLGLTYPDRYATAASLSGALDVVRLVAVEERQPELAHIFGDLDKLKNSPHDLLHLARQVAQSNGPKPRLFAWCGTEDFLYEDNVAFRDEVEKLDMDFTYSEGTGDHSWEYWDEHIQDVLEWMGY